MNIAQNPYVAFSIDEDYEDWMKIQGVQMEGRAKVLADPEETRHAADVYLKKFPQVASFPPDPKMVFVKVEPVTGFFLDYTKEFGHRSRVTF